MHSCMCIAVLCVYLARVVRTDRSLVGREPLSLPIFSSAPVSDAKNAPCLGERHGSDAKTHPAWERGTEVTLKTRPVWRGAQK